MLIKAHANIGPLYILMKISKKISMAFIKHMINIQKKMNKRMMQLQRGFYLKYSKDQIDKIIVSEKKYLIFTSKKTSEF